MTKSSDPHALLRHYLARMAEIRGTGGATAETSYYSVLEAILNEVGRQLTPNVVCNGQLRNQGAGHPDFGLYSRSQCQKGEPKPGQGEVPERGVVEVKKLKDSTWQTVQSRQATRYFDQYRLVLVTNYREFRLIGEGPDGKPVERDFFRLANDEAEFWSLTNHPEKSGRAVGKQFVEFLKRVMINAAPLTRAQNVAWLLASYARDALVTLEEKDASALDPLKHELESALGVKFRDEKGEHFFRSTLIQTLIYGLFSAWAIWARSKATPFDWKMAAHVLTTPMVRSLFEEIAKPSRLKPLDLMGILDRTGEALNRIDRSSFFKSFDEGHAIQYFYEPFLAAFDPVLRKDLGVWYTPPEIVRYMVARVDEQLRFDLGIRDGLADENVYVLDPCCGTGAFLIEVLRKIEETLRAKGADALIGDDIKEAAMKRVFGFELMSAPFVIAHWQIGSFLSSSSINAPLDAKKGERPAIYLTNSLTGWLPPKGPKATLALFPELSEERDQAEHVKRDAPILVILGNPPYDGFAGASPEEEEGLVEPYKEGLAKKWRIVKSNLGELYVRFLRIAERRIVSGGRGILCYISSYSYLSDPSFVVAREKLLNEFDSIWIDCLNGDSRETGKRTPEGLPDPSVFSTELNRQGIRLGTAVGLFVRRSKRAQSPNVRFRDFWGHRKRAELLESLNAKPFGASYEVVSPNPQNKYSFRPTAASEDYLSWPTVPELSLVPPISGLQKMRKGTLMSIDRNELVTRLSAYFDPSADWSAVVAGHFGPVENAGRFDAKKARKALLDGGTRFDRDAIKRYALYPLDTRYCYYSSQRPLWNEPRPELIRQTSGFPDCIVVRMHAERPNENVPITFTRAMPDYHLLRPNAVAIPFIVSKKDEPINDLFSEEKSSLPNLSDESRRYLQH